MAHPEHWPAHRICEDCWLQRFDQRPVRVPFELGTCCLCGARMRNLDIQVSLPPNLAVC